MSAPGKPGAHRPQLGDVCERTERFKNPVSAILSPIKGKHLWIIKMILCKCWWSQNLFLLINELHKPLSPAAPCAILSKKKLQCAIS